MQHISSTLATGQAQHQNTGIEMVDAASNNDMGLLVVMDADAHVSLPVSILEKVQGQPSNNEGMDERGTIS